MPPQTPPDPAAATERPSRMSRRSLLRGAAGAGAVGLVAAGGAGAVAELARPGQPATAAATAPGALPPGTLKGPLMVYLRDAKTGEMDVFAGTSQVSLRDPALASQLLRALQ